ncbi:hypothetical protein LAZ67_18001756 [Cordylochernes scorpioides]|uniref:Transposase n=1 Tax=Cordylochernes scorpioides TaxID=51811 RepID=A0ABY6LIT5_9ARAC|nr:hypothetical protein LAZ67_18001756 [Cordylochernes scorpioides]
MAIVFWDMQVVVLIAFIEEGSTVNGFRYAITLSNLREAIRKKSKIPLKSVNYKYLEEGQTINKESYLNIMRRVRESTRLKRREMWSSKNWINHHDNAPPHTATPVLTYLAKHGIQILQQPPYSPDLASNDFFLFPKLKMALKGRRFDTRESIIVDLKKVLKNIPKDAFSKCFTSWEKKWKLCIDAGGDYFEKY